MATARLTPPTAMDDLFLYRISRLLATAGAPVIRLCEGKLTTLDRSLGLLKAHADGLARQGRDGPKADQRRGGGRRQLAG